MVNVNRTENEVIHADVNITIPFDAAKLQNMDTSTNQQKMLVAFCKKTNSSKSCANKCNKYFASESEHHRQRYN